MYRKKFICADAGCCLSTTPEPEKIIIHGASANNLKGICFEIPKNKLVALTGLSGSGKSTIAFDVLANECVRQFLDSIGMVTDHVPKTKVGTIMGLSPAIAISQRVTDFNPRSTVGTRSGILTILRNLFATIGHQVCCSCGTRVKQPLQSKERLNTMAIGGKEEDSSSKKKSYFDCPHCKEQLEKLSMSHFSPNTLSGACEACKGIGEIVTIDTEKLLDFEKSLLNGGVKYWEPSLAKHYIGTIEAASRYYQFGFEKDLPLKAYTEEQISFLLHGINCSDFIKRHQNIKPPKKVSEGKYEGIIPSLLSQYKSNPKKVPRSIQEYIVHTRCTECNASRLNKLGREATISGKTISEITSLTLCEFLYWLESLKQSVSTEETQSLAVFSNALYERALNLIEVGLEYLTLDRTLPSLSSGESQRLRLAAALGSGLTGVLYILDEPTAGQHPHDTEKLLLAFKRIKEAGNTVLVIEHDLDVIRNVDYVIDVGPDRGSKGGEIVIAGTPDEIEACSISITGRYLKMKSLNPVKVPRKNCEEFITVCGASAHNLNDIDVMIPLAQLVVLTGVSGSGKSTFLFDILNKVARNQLNAAHEIPGKHTSVSGLQNFTRVVTVDQASIGRTRASRSNVATYTKLFDLIRNLFADLPEAKALGYDANTFSFNVSDECCDNCCGAGTIKIEMAFMPGIDTECPVCNGMRFNDNLLAVKYRGCSISQILDMTVKDAAQFFADERKISDNLNLMIQVGLEHLTLGQSTSTLSGGEAQRIKLASELSRSKKGSTLYLLDEPTTGLHAQEVEKLLVILDDLVQRGNTVVIIEHNLDIISQADTIIDFGPGGGAAGGNIVASGSPQDIMEKEDSLTGQALRTHMSVYNQDVCR